MGAAILAILANLENFSNSQERAQAYLESREAFLDAARQFQLLWTTHVDPFYPGPDACVNAVALHRQLNIKDSELRARFMEKVSPKGGQQ